jgi:hypothetical protein
MLDLKAVESDGRYDVRVNGLVALSNAKVIQLVQSITGYTMDDVEVGVFESSQSGYAHSSQIVRGLIYVTQAKASAYNFSRRFVYCDPIRLWFYPHFGKQLQMRTEWASTN